MITIVLNGADRQVASETVIELVQELGQSPEALLIEHNGLALHRSEWSDAIIRKGDQLEFLRVTAGG